MNAEELNKAIDFYKNGNSLTQTCKKFHSTLNTLKKLFKEQNIPIRTQSEQAIIENIKRTKPINHFYFSSLNDEKAYYLGFIAGDGTIRKDRNEIKISLSIIDKSFLEKFKEKIEATDSTIYTYLTNKGFEYCEFRFSSAKIKSDLINYGIVPNKTYTGLNLNNIPKEYYLPFIKGYFDADGCFSYNKDTKQAKVSFISYSDNILKDIQKYFQNGNIYMDKRNKIYSLEFSTIPSIEIMNEFYEIDTPCLERKKEKFMEFLKLRNNIPRDRDSLNKDEKIC